MKTLTFMVKPMVQAGRDIHTKKKGNLQSMNRLHALFEVFYNTVL